ncbi:MAG: radical SAM protein, partial [Firmicutes bacterium]|nr:radical SAM protein [Bacillota bacterium]
MKQVIREVREGSIGEELGLERGDALIRIDGSEIEDVLDYYYLLEGESIELEILTKDGETVFCQVDKDEDE